MPNRQQPIETREFDDDGVTWLAALFAPPEIAMAVPAGFEPRYKLRFRADGRDDVIRHLGRYEPLEAMSLDRLRQLRMGS